MLKTLAKAGIIAVDGRAKLVRRHPDRSERFPQTETKSVRTIVERGFMDLVLHRDIRPSQQINTLDLARQFSVSSSAVREYLADFSRCGLLERRPNSSWIFRGFDLAFASELSHVRELFEIDSALKFADLPPADPRWQKLTCIEAQHIQIFANINGRYTEFSRVDELFHGLIMSASCNRFIDEFHNLLCLIFSYHYQWSKITEKRRNMVGIREHLAYIAALRSRDLDAVRATALAHLRTARESLIDAMECGSEAHPPDKIQRYRGTN